jgi:hypothetical protein
VLRFTGSDIRHRSSRRITGESACPPSWDGIGFVLDEGENSCFVRLPLTSCVASSVLPEDRPAYGCVRVPVEAQRHSVAGKRILDQGIHTRAVPFFISLQTPHCVLLVSNHHPFFDFLSVHVHTPILHVTCRAAGAAVCQMNIPVIDYPFCSHGFAHEFAFLVSGSNRMVPNSLQREPTTLRECTTSHRVYLPK